MKIIGHTEYGFIVEMHHQEMTAACGKTSLTSYRDYNSSQEKITHHLPVGTSVGLVEKINHIDKLQENESARKKIAEQLRAAASVIETAPSPFDMPEPPAPVKSAAEELREALS